MRGSTRGFPLEADSKMNERILGQGMVGKARGFQEKRVWGRPGCGGAWLGQELLGPGCRQSHRGGQPAGRAPTTLGTRLLLNAAAGQGKPVEPRRQQKEAQKAIERATRWRKESWVLFSCLPLTRLSLLTLVSLSVRWS